MDMVVGSTLAGAGSRMEAWNGVPRTGGRIAVPGDTVRLDSGAGACGMSGGKGRQVGIKMDEERETSRPTRSACASRK